jgi:hypothetical protein
MIFFEPDLSFEILDLLSKRIKTKTGEIANHEASQKINEYLSSLFPSIKEKVVPKAVCRELPVIQSDKKCIHTEAGDIESPMFRAMADMCEKNRYIVFMIVTLGAELEKLAASSREIFFQWFLDIAGSELVEIVADLIETIWKNRTDQQGRQFCNRFSPGYCDWPLEGQRVIFNALNAEKIGVKLTSHMSMTPKKTISSIMLSSSKTPIKLPCPLCIKKEFCLMKNHHGRK